MKQNHTLLREHHYIILNVHSQVKALQSHREPALDGFHASEEKLAVPMSDVNLAEFRSFIEVQKADAAPIETDCKDAKRRINVAKGPRPKKHTPAVKAESDDSDEEQPQPGSV